MIIICLLLISLVGTVYDIKYRKIPNCLIFCGLILGFFNSLLCCKTDSLLCDIAASILIIVLLFPFYYSRGLGAGDIKLFSLIPYYVSNNELLWFFLILFVFGAILAFLIFLISYASHLIRFLPNCLRSNHITAVFFSPISSSKRITIPMAIPYTCTIIVFILLSYFNHSNFY